MPKKFNYNDDFKLQMVNLMNSGKKITELVEEYGVTRSTLNKWKSDYQLT
ncbi:MAG: helix-turn-helix domain containing protein [Clostridioides sp.]|jgi:transposase|nr:helix-turn-helix domain containing protein [Clostridioides sp.]